jgi:hypothetical protein
MVVKEEATVVAKEEVTAAKEPKLMVVKEEMIVVKEQNPIVVKEETIVVKEQNPTVVKEANLRRAAKILTIRSQRLATVRTRRNCQKESPESQLREGIRVNPSSTFFKIWV